MDKIMSALAGLATLFFLLAVGTGLISPAVAVEAVVISGATVAIIIMYGESVGPYTPTAVGRAVTIVIAGIIVGVSFAISAISGSAAFASLVIGVILGMFWASAIKETLK